MAEPAAVPRPGVQRGQRHPGPGAGRVAPTPPPPFPPCFPWGTGAGPPCASPGGRAAWRRRGAGVRPGSDGGVAVTPWGGLGLTGRPRRTGRLRHCSGNAEPWPSSEAVYPGARPGVWEGPRNAERAPGRHIPGIPGPQSPRVSRAFGARCARSRSRWPCAGRRVGPGRPQRHRSPLGALGQVRPRSGPVRIPLSV